MVELLRLGGFVPTGFASNLRYSFSLKDTIQALRVLQLSFGLFKQSVEELVGVMLFGYFDGQFGCWIFDGKTEVLGFERLPTAVLQVGEHPSELVHK